MTKTEYMRAYRAAHPGDAARRERNRRNGVKDKRLCRECGKEFEVSNHFRYFCSDACRITENRRRAGCVNTHGADPLTPVNCKFCGKSFTPYHQKDAFCSKSCLKKYNYWKCGKTEAEAKSAEKKAERNKLREARKKRVVLAEKPKSVCQYCGEEFTPFRAGQRFCSEKCARRFRSHGCDRRTYEESISAPRTCAWCGNVFVSMRKDKVCCSSVCRARFYDHKCTKEEFEKRRVRRAEPKKVNHRGEVSRNSFGLTADEAREVIQAQDGDLNLLWKRSQSWNERQRKFAKKRYEVIHGI